MRELRPNGTHLERETGLEPATTCLEGRGSTTELLPRAISVPRQPELRAEAGSEYNGLEQTFYRQNRFGGSGARFRTRRTGRLFPMKRLPRQQKQQT